MGDAPAGGSSCLSDGGASLLASDSWWGRSTESECKKSNKRERSWKRLPQAILVETNKTGTKQSKTEKGVARDQSGDGLGCPEPVITCRHRAREDSVKNLARNEGSGRFSPSRVGTDSIFLGETRLGSWARKARDTRSTQAFTSTTWPPPVGERQHENVPGSKRKREGEPFNLNECEEHRILSRIVV